jgi:hypothetical protein
MPVPGVDIDALRIEAAAGELRQLGRTSLSRVETIGLDWKALRGAYQAPETPQLLSVPDEVFTPPATQTQSAVDLVADALEEFAQRARPLVEELRRLAAQPTSFETQDQINGLVEALTARETECADAIRSAIAPTQAASGLTAGELAQVVGGGLLIVLGGAGEVGGAGLDTTVVGAPPGIALGAASTGAIFYGRRLILGVLGKETAEEAAGLAGTVERGVVNGETAATRLGRYMHKVWDYGPGFRKEFTLPSGRRVDALNFQTRQVVELKPNNPRAVRLGERQVARYLEELNETYPGEVPWTGSVVTYGAP